MRFGASFLFASVVLVGCGTPATSASQQRASSPARGGEAGDPADAAAQPPLAPAAATGPSPTVKAPPDPATVFARIEPRLVDCYEQGRKAVPTMVSGKLTLNASIDAAGEATCVIPTDDTGLTQEVEDCMSARLAAERFDGGPWSVAVPVAVRAGKVELGTRASGTAGIESVETHRMPDAFDVLESLVPELQACVREIDRSSGVRAVMVGARVGTNGRTECALATGSPGAMPTEAAACTEGALRKARFPPPSGGPGLILVPITIRR